MIISLSRDFVLLPGSSYHQRFSSGDVRLDKTGSKEYKLSILSIQPSDQGEVYCEAVEWIQDPDETWKDIARKQTNRTSLTVRSLDSHMQLLVSVNNKQITEGSALVFHCNGTTADKALSVTWWHIQKDGDPPLFIASMDQDGKLKVGPSYLERSVYGELRLEKLGPSTFTLTIYNSSATKDTGLYRCEVTEWSKGKSWKHSREISTKVEPLGLNVKAVLSSRIPNVKLSEDFQLFCKVYRNGTINELPVSITWQFKPSSDMADYQQVVKVTAEGTIEWGSAHLHLQKKAKITKSFSSSWLLIHSAIWQDAGMYRCEADLWKNSGPTRSSALAAAAVVFSNPVEIKVTKPESELDINIDAKSLEISSNEDKTIDCKIKSLTKRNVLLGITWYFLPLSSKDGISLMILRTNYTQILEYGEAFSSPHQRSRFHSKKVSSQLYQLLILSADYDVQGKYYCEVDEWIWLMDTGWYRLGKMESDKTTVYFKFSENKLHIEGTNHSITTTENEDVTLKCILQSIVQPTFYFSVSWFKVSEHFHAETLVEIKSNGIIRYGNVNMARRLQLHCPSVGNFHLTLQNVEMVDAGLFYCQVEEWQATNSTIAHVQHASSQSGYSNLIVLPSVSTSSSQICSSRLLYHFILCYPPVLFLIMMTVFLILYFKRKHVQKKEMALEQNKTFGEEFEVLAPSHFEHSDKICSNSHSRE